MSSITFFLCIITGIISGSLVAEEVISIWLIFLVQLPLAALYYGANPFFKQMLDE